MHPNYGILATKLIRPRQMYPKETTYASYHIFNDMFVCTFVLKL